MYGEGMKSKLMYSIRELHWVKKLLPEKGE